MTIVHEKPLMFRGSQVTVPSKQRSVTVLATVVTTAMCPSTNAVQCAGCIAWNLVIFSGVLATFTESSQVLSSKL